MAEERAVAGSVGELLRSINHIGPISVVIAIAAQTIFVAFILGGVFERYDARFDGQEKRITLIETSIDRMTTLSHQLAIQQTQLQERIEADRALLRHMLGQKEAMRP